MTISEKSAYLKGLMEGMNLNTESNEGKMIAAIVDLLGDMAKRVTDIEETTIAISDELDEIEEDLDAIEDFIMDEDDDDYEDYDDEDEWDDDEDSDEGFEFGDEETTIYEAECPSCGEVVDFDEETLTTINKFFENSLNVSETSRQLYIHRNTLVYRLDKLQKYTGLDLRVFEDAITFKIALMVVKYMKYMESLDY